MGSDFRVNLYRRKMDVDEYGVINPLLVAKKSATNETDETNPLFEFSLEEKQILAILRENADMTQRQLHEVTGISLGTIKRMLPKLQERGKLKRVGSRRAGKWIVAEEK